MSPAEFHDLVALSATGSWTNVPSGGTSAGSSLWRCRAGSRPCASSSAWSAA